MHASAAPSDVVKMVSGRFPTSLLVLCRSNFSCARECSIAVVMTIQIFTNLLCAFPSRRCIWRADIYRLLVDGEHKNGGSWSACFSWSMGLLPIADLIIGEHRIGRASRRFPQAWRVSLIFLEDGLQVLTGG